jgi:hypothetical protein
VDLLLETITLLELKQFIVQQVFPCLEDNWDEPIVRIFHLGRELKSLQRTLEKLGVGRYRHNSVLHVHILQSKFQPPPPPPPLPPPVQQSQAVLTSKRRNARFSLPVTGLLTNTNSANKPIIELLDDNDEDHDDNNNHEAIEEVIVIEPPYKKHRF